jgi:hypothetical protein
MLWWAVILVFLVVLAFLSQLQILFLLGWKYPVLAASGIHILILVCLGGVLFRILSKAKKGEKEILIRRIQELEQQLEALKKK